MILRTRKILRTLEHRAFVAVIISTRKAKKLTQEDVAQRVARITKTKKPDRSWISRVESGERVLGAVELTWLAEAMDELPETLVAKARKWVEVEKGK